MGMGDATSPREPRRPAAGPLQRRTSARIPRRPHARPSLHASSRLSPERLSRLDYSGHSARARSLQVRLGSGVIETSSLDATWIPASARHSTAGCAARKSSGTLPAASPSTSRLRGRGSPGPSGGTCHRRSAVARHRAAAHRACAACGFRAFRPLRPAVESRILGHPSGTVSRGPPGRRSASAAARRDGRTVRRHGLHEPD